MSRIAPMRRIRLRRVARIARDQSPPAAPPQNGAVSQTENIVNAPILVPFDGSASARRALEHAIGLAKSDPSTVHVINVELPLDEYGMVPAYLPEKKHHRLTAQRAAALLAPAAARLEKEGVAHETHVAWGEAAACIARAAKRLKCGSIVMGTRGMGAVGNLLFGSTATKLVRLSPVPVTLVKSR
jgi:nucleotide-binding universal stress UspA family protein